MSDVSITSTSRQQSQLDDNGRKRSFGRMFDKIRMALRKREMINVARPSSHTTVQDIIDSGIPRFCEDPIALLAVDDEEQGVAEQAIVPLELLGRNPTGISEAKARQFFEQHGLTYHTRETNDEPAAKLRRVERSVRMRVRWTCHSCRSIFGVEKYCPGCGHRRCFECSRDPCHKVRVSELRERTEATSLAIRPGASIAAQPISHNAILAVDTLTAKPQSQAWQCTIQIGRPRADSYLVSHVSSPDHQPHCHSCEKPVNPSAARCIHCHHDLCALCPMFSEATTQAASAVPLVERVYKKPRQRVRYNCENCNVQFTDRHECSECGHERCENCPRFPPRKQKHVHDAAAWAAVQAKLAMVSTAPSLTVPETTLSIMDTPHARL